MIGGSSQNIGVKSMRNTSYSIFNSVNIPKSKQNSGPTSLIVSAEFGRGELVEQINKAQGQEVKTPMSESLQLQVRRQQQKPKKINRKLDEEQELDDQASSLLSSFQIAKQKEYEQAQVKDYNAKYIHRTGQTQQTQSSQLLKMQKFRLDKEQFSSKAMQREPQHQSQIAVGMSYCISSRRTQLTSINSQNLPTFGPKKRPVELQRKPIAKIDLNQAIRDQFKNIKSSSIESSIDGLQHAIMNFAKRLSPSSSISMHNYKKQVQKKVRSKLFSRGSRTGSSHSNRRPAQRMGNIQYLLSNNQNRNKSNDFELFMRQHYDRSQNHQQQYNITNNLSQQLQQQLSKYKSFESFKFLRNNNRASPTANAGTNILQLPTVNPGFTSFSNAPPSHLDDDKSQSQILQIKGVANIQSSSSQKHRVFGGRFSMQSTPNKSNVFYSTSRVQAQKGQQASAPNNNDFSGAIRSRSVSPPQQQQYINRSLAMTQSYEGDQTPQLVSRLNQQA